MKENILVVEGKALNEREGVSYLHHGIAGRGFESRFQIADNVQVTGANFKNGLLHIDLECHTPEHVKLKPIEIAKAA